MGSKSTIRPRIREEALRDPRYPVAQIADQLLPYLKTMVDEFSPEQIVLFGSFAWGHPGPDSDVDLLVLKPIERSPAADATMIRRAVRHLRHSASNLPLDIMVRDPADFARRVANGGAVHVEIARKGIALV